MSQSGSSKKIALSIAAVISLITAGAMVLSHFVLSNIFSIVLIVVCMVEFILIYSFTNNAIRELITEHITPLYQIISYKNLSRKEIKNRLKSGDLNEVNDEVSAWSIERSNEIRRLYSMEQYRKEFIGNVSHELKTPIFNIQGYISTLLEGGIDDPSINLKYLNKAEKNIDRLIHIVEDLNVIVGLETGEMQMKFESFDLVKLAHEAIAAVELQANQRHIKITVEHNIQHVYVKADRHKILQVFINLLSNSIKYGKEHGKTKVGFSVTPDRVFVNINDDGIGIESKELSRIFERFYRVDKHRSREVGGSGLGLSIVKHILEAHNQNIHVRSKVNEGSTFVFSLDK